MVAIDLPIVPIVFDRFGVQHREQGRHGWLLQAFDTTHDESSQFTKVTTGICSIRRLGQTGITGTASFPKGCLLLEEAQESLATTSLRVDTDFLEFIGGSNGIDFGFSTGRKRNDEM
jgi:hypothetical protein